MYNRIFFGKLAEVLEGFSDFTSLEFFTSAILVILIILAGVNPGLITNFAETEYTKYNI